MTDTGVPAPATALWDVNAVVERALTILRLSDGDVDEALVDDFAMQAVDRVDAFVDRPGPAEPTAAMLNEAVDHTVFLYRRKDAPFGVAESWSVDTVAANVPRGFWNRSELLPDKERWGVA